MEIALAAICGPQDVLTTAPEDRDNPEIAQGHRRQNDRIPRQRLPFRVLAASRIGLGVAKKGSHYRNHMNAKAVPDRIDPALFDRFGKVTIVRTPLGRDVSLYYWHTRDMVQKPSFDRFVRRSLTNPERETYKIYPIDGRIVADTVLRYETCRRILPHSSGLWG